MIALVELLEAEARALKGQARRFGFGLFFLVMAGILGLAALGFGLAAAYLYLSRFLDSPSAALVCGLGSLILTGGLLWTAR